MAQSSVIIIGSIAVDGGPARPAVMSGVASTLGTWGGVAPPYVDIGGPGPQPPPLGIWGGSSPWPGYVGGGPMPGGPPPGIWGGGGVPMPTPPIYLPPGSGIPQPPVIWGGGGVPMPTPPIFIPPEGGGGQPPGGGGGGNANWQWAYSPAYGWVLVPPGGGGKPQPPGEGGEGAPHPEHPIATP